MIHLLGLAACLQAPFYLHNGDRVTFYGDSITEDGSYGVYVEMYLRTHFPKLDVHFYNCGWGGDRVSGGGGGPAEERVTKDFKPTNPSVVTVMLGMNDGGYTPFADDKDKAFADGYHKLIQLLLAAAPKARYTLIQTTPYDDFTYESRHYNDVLLKMGLHVKELASKYKFDYVDFNAPLVQMLTQAAHDDAKLANQILTPDRIHPRQAGHLLMAATLLKAWNAPSLVSEVTLDGKSGEVQKSVGAKVAKTGVLSWTETDEILPMPINWQDPTIRLTADSDGVVSALDDETLTITNLNSGTYSLAIDGHEVLKASADDLGKGVNLAHYATPMLFQAFQVGSLVQMRAQTYMYQWRTLRRTEAQFVNTEAAAKALDPVQEELIKKAQAAAVPTPHTFTLSKVE